MSKRTSVGALNAFRLTKCFCTVGLIELRFFVFLCVKRDPTWSSSAFMFTVSCVLARVLSSFAFHFFIFRIF